MTPNNRVFLGKFLFLFFLIGGLGPVSQAGEDSAILKYTYRTDQGSVSLLNKGGKRYVPLMDTAKFYGIDVTFDPQTRKVLLKKGSRTVKIILSQPLFLLVNPPASAPIDPVEVISGQLAAPIESVSDILSGVLNINVRYLPDSQTVMVGGVSDSEIRQEIMTEAKSLTPTPGPKLVLMAAPTNTPALVIEAVPTATPQFVIEAPNATQTPVETAGMEEVDETPAPIPGQDELPPSKEIFQVRRIIIDAGHGGVDNGARGYDKRYTEKQATLDIARKVAGILNKHNDLEVFLTRSGDYYITLKYRTTFANEHDGDLFVSIHCNANPNTEAYGTETYFYSTKASNQAAEVAAVHENKDGDIIDSMLNSLHNQAYRLRSFELAKLVDAHIRERMGQHIRRIQQAPFYVLARVNMPSILVETAFITNPREEEKLKDEDWRDKIAHAIADGILAYRDEMQKVEGNFGNKTSTQ
jgi:N-acetylmuramoyl-L-alanine amidase